jgi:hypothetical protein
MALQGIDCALSSLAVCATETAGSVNVLHPLEWGKRGLLVIRNPHHTLQLRRCRE